MVGGGDGDGIVERRQGSGQRRPAEPQRKREGVGKVTGCERSFTPLHALSWAEWDKWDIPHISQNRFRAPDI